MDTEDECDEYERDEPMPKCYACGGSGLTIEGWDCEICDGIGELDI